MTTTLAAQLRAAEDTSRRDWPIALRENIYKTLADHICTFNASATIQVGDELPPFTMSNALGKDITSKSLIAGAAKGILITVTRGKWCPYCVLTLEHQQKYSADFAAMGVTLVAISPQMPNQSLIMVQESKLKFEVLSDVGNHYARQLGISWRAPSEFISELFKFGVDLAACNGDSTGVLPVPTTLMVDKFGIVRNIYLDTDWRTRMETTTALNWAEDLNGIRGGCKCLYAHLKSASYWFWILSCTRNGELGSQSRI